VDIFCRQKGGIGSFGSPVAQGGSWVNTVVGSGQIWQYGSSHYSNPDCPSGSVCGGVQEGWTLVGTVAGTVQTFLAQGGQLPPGANPAAQAAKQMAENATRNGKYGPKTTPPTNPTPVNEPEPQIYENPLEQFQRMLELWFDGNGTTIFFVMPSYEVNPRGFFPSAQCPTYPCKI